MSKLVACKKCGTALPSGTSKCKNCGQSLGMGCGAKLGLVLGASLLLLSWCASRTGAHFHGSGGVSSGQAATPQANQVAQPWTGVAPWVEVLQKLIKSPGSIKPKSRPQNGLDDDGHLTLAVYDLSTTPQKEGVATMGRVRGKPSAWWWQIAGIGIRPTDVAPSDQLEKLYDSKSGETWYAILGGPFAGKYMSFKSQYMQNQSMIALETAEFSESENEGGLQPWLCSHGRVSGKKSLGDGMMVVQCRELVQQMLKAPSSADFQGMLSGVREPQYYGNCDMEWKSWVEAKNAFGVMIRNGFVCNYNARTDKLSAKFQQ